MLVAILGNKDKICLLDCKSKINNMYYAICGKDYEKQTHTLFSLDQQIDNICSMCKKHIKDLYGSNDNALYYNIQQQNIINSHGEYQIFLSKTKRKLNLFNISINKIKRIYESR